MFKSGSRDREADAPPSNAAAARRGMFSVLGPDVVVTGNINAASDLHVDGRVEGDVTCGSLIQGGDSQIVGSVAAEVARIAGAIEGSVRACQLEIESTARITGDVEYEAITIENGARVDGNLKHKSKGTIRPSATTDAPNVTPIARAGDGGDPAQRQLIG